MDYSVVKVQHEGRGDMPCLYMSSTVPESGSVRSTQYLIGERPLCVLHVCITVESLTLCFTFRLAALSRGPLCEAGAQSPVSINRARSLKHNTEDFLLVVRKDAHQLGRSRSCPARSLPYGAAWVGFSTPYTKMYSNFTAVKRKVGRKSGCLRARLW